MFYEKQGVETGVGRSGGRRPKEESGKGDIMKRRWTKTAFLLILMLMVCSCATAPKAEKTDKPILEKSNEEKIEKIDEKGLEKNEEKAIKKLAKEIAKDRATDFYLKGMTDFNEGDFKDAIIAFKKALDENPKDYQAYYALGQSYEKLNKAKEAEAAYGGTINVKSDYLPAREVLGLLYFHQMNFKEAEPQLKEARTLGSQVAEVYYGLGEIEQRENACATAIMGYKQALKLNPDYLAARNGLKVSEDDCRQKQLQKQKQTPPPQQRQKLQQPPRTNPPR
jgi:tetratricopeptide (TPR) repeat protein